MAPDSVMRSLGHALTVIPIDVLALLAIAVVFPYLWRHRHSPSGIAIVGMVVSTALWIVGHGLELAVQGLNFKIALSLVQYVAGFGLLYWFALFAIRYTGRLRWLRAHEWLVAVPLVVVFLWVITNPLHGLHWTGFETDPAGHVTYLRGPLYWGFVFVSYFYLATIQILLLRAAAGLRGIYRRQMLVMFMVGLIPWVGSVFYMLQLPGFEVDLAPPLSGIMAVGIGIAAQRFGLLDIVPVAESTVLRHITDPIVVTDFRHRVVLVNSAAGVQFGLDAKAVVGQSIKDVFSCWPGLVHKMEHNSLSAGVSHTTVEELPFAHGSKFYDVTAISLDQKGSDSSGSAVWLFRDETRRELAERALREQASRDPLTGLYNVRYFNDRIDAEIIRADATGQSVSLIMIDFDGFKEINTEFGHLAGDKYLVDVSRFLAKQVPLDSPICRVGGDEFTVIVPGANPDDAARMGRDLQAALRAEGPRRPDGAPVEFSFGVSTYPDYASNANSLRLQADMALYHVKSTAGGSGATFGDSGIDAPA